ncbi:MAG: permease [Prolixibacteraceae bacterium]|nr:permease [Prolixibacteraceae bacterium]
MKNYWKRHRTSLVFTIIFSVLISLSFITDFQPGISIGKDRFWVFLKEMILFLPLMFILIGLGDVWISKEKTEKHLGEQSGIKGMFVVIIMSMAQVGPLYGAFPVAYLLWKKGTSVRNIFIYLGAFCTIKIPMLTFEIGFLGWKFSLIRTLLSLPLIILIGILMERYFKNRKFEMFEG